MRKFVTIHYLAIIFLSIHSCATSSKVMIIERKLSPEIYKNSFAALSDDGVYNPNETGTIIKEERYNNVSECHIFSNSLCSDLSLIKKKIKGSFWVLSYESYGLKPMLGGFSFIFIDDKTKMIIGVYSIF